MTPETKIIDINLNNIEQYPQIICFINHKHESYPLKISWLKKRFQEGLKIKLLYVTGQKKPIGFIEYLPGENAWRAVEAKGYLFIHCLFINGNKYRHDGLGTLLINAAEKDGKDTYGVATLTSDKAFMANKEIFIKNGYQIAQEKGSDQLLVKLFQKKVALPKINNYGQELTKYQGLNILYSKQCPWVARSIPEIVAFAKKQGLDVKVVEFQTAQQAQKAPSVYSVFNLIYNGKILADRYISLKRFSNILKKELN